MGFRKDVLKIMDSKSWFKGNIVRYEHLWNIIIEQLDVSDRRAIVKWIGKNRIVWKRKRQTLTMWKNVKRTEWKKGLLEEFDIIRRYDYPKNHPVYQFEKGKTNFKILKDKTDFQK